MAQGRLDTEATEQTVDLPARQRSIAQTYYRHRYLFILLAAALVWTITFLGEVVGCFTDGVVTGDRSPVRGGTRIEVTRDDGSRLVLEFQA